MAPRGGQRDAHSTRNALDEDVICNLGRMEVVETDEEPTVLELRFNNWIAEDGFRKRTFANSPRTYKDDVAPFLAQQEVENFMEKPLSTEKDRGSRRRGFGTKLSAAQLCLEKAQCTRVTEPYLLERFRMTV